MAHDRQVEREPESSTALNKQPRTCSDVVLNWLRLYQAMPYMRGEHQITEEVILFYVDSLGQLKNPLALHKAFQWCRDHINFLPQPKEILEAYGAALEKMRAKEPEERPLTKAERAALLESPEYQERKAKILAKWSG